MPAVPHVETRGDQPYVAIRARVTMAELGGLGGRFGEVFGWLAARGLAPAGAPFFRYSVIDMARELEVDVGVPVAAVVDDGGGEVIPGVLPAADTRRSRTRVPPASSPRPLRCCWTGRPGRA